MEMKIEHLSFGYRKDQCLNDILTMVPASTPNNSGPLLFIPWITAKTTAFDHVNLPSRRATAASKSPRRASQPP